MQTIKEEFDTNKIKVEQYPNNDDDEERIEYPSLIDIKKDGSPLHYSPAEICDVKMECDEDNYENDECCSPGNSQQPILPFRETSKFNNDTKIGTNSSTIFSNTVRSLANKDVYICEDSKCACYEQKNAKKIDSHNYETVYRCTHCSYAAKKKTDLFVHRKIHKKEKLYQCAHCTFETNRENILKTHLHTHIGETPHHSVHCNLKSLFRTVHNDDSAIEFLKNSNIIPRIKLCENGHEMKFVYYNSNSPTWRCEIRTCRKSIGVRRGTWLENSRLSFHNVVLFIYYWTREMTSQKWCEHELNMNHNTVIDWNNYLREVCLYRLEQLDSTIGGEGIIVEIDESLFARRKNNQGKILPQQWIFAGLCRQTKECFIVRVPDRSAVTLFAIILQRIKSGSIIVSDRCEEFDSVSSLLMFAHQSANHRLNFVNPSSLVSTKRVEDMWGTEKWGNRNKRGTERSFSESRLVEFMWRARLDNRDPFLVILEDINLFWSAQIQQDQV